MSRPVLRQLYQNQPYQHQRCRNLRHISARFPARQAVVVVANDLIAYGAFRHLSRIVDGYGAGTDEGGDEHGAGAVRAAIRDAVHFVDTVAAVTGSLDCTACYNRSISQSVNQLINRSINHLINQSINH